MTNNRVVITGVGIYSCIGKNINEVTNSLKEGKSGIGIDSARTDMGYRSALTGIIDIPILKIRKEVEVEQLDRINSVRMQRDSKIVQKKLQGIFSYKHSNYLIRKILFNY